MFKIHVESRAPPRYTKLLLRSLSPKVQKEKKSSTILVNFIHSVILITPDHILYPLQPKNPLPPEDTSQTAKVNIQLQLLQEHLVH